MVGALTGSVAGLATITPAAGFVEPWAAAVIGLAATVVGYLGGQLVPAPDVDRLLADIKSGALAGWTEIHQAYDRLWREYPLRKQQHALATLLSLLGTQTLTPAAWNAALDQAIAIQELIRDRVYLSRKKDYDDPFRQTTFRNPEEMRAVVGTPEDNSFVAQVRQETEAFRSLAVAAHVA